MVESTLESIHDWPYPDVEQRFQNDDKSWREVDWEIYIDQLEALPPAKTGMFCFAVGEPWRHTERGAIHAVFVKIGKRYFCRMDALKDFSPNLYRREIQKQLEEE